MPKNKIVAIPKTRTVVEHKDEVKPASVTYALSVPMNYNYVSNAFSRKTNHQSDMVLVFSPSFAVGIPVIGADTLQLGITTGLLRYDEFSVLSGDNLQTSVAYAKVLSKGTWTLSDQTSATQSTQILKPKIGTLYVFAPGFGSPSTNFYTPAIEWSVETIPVGSWLCGVGAKQAHCLQAKLSVEANKTWSDEAIRDNASALAAAELAWVMADKGLRISASTTATGKVWDHVPGGRTDAIFAFSSTVAWNPNENVALSGGFAYTNQASSPSTLSWDGYRVLPQVRAILRW